MNADSEQHSLVALAFAESDVGKGMSVCAQTLNLRTRCEELLARYGRLLNSAALQWLMAEKEMAYSIAKISCT